MRKYGKITPREGLLDPPVTPVHHQGVIQQSINAENGIESTQEYCGGNKILSVDHKLYVYDYPQMYTYSILLSN